MKRKMVIIGIDDIVRIFADYAYLTGFPTDAKAEKLFLNPQERKLMISVSSDSITSPQPPEEIKFQLKRSYLV